MRATCCREAAYLNPFIDRTSSCLRPASDAHVKRSASWRAPMRRSIMELMQLVTGTVLGGKVVVDGDPLPEGTVVTILAREADETFEVPPELEAELLESIAQAERGETISANELIERLRRIA